MKRICVLLLTAMLILAFDFTVAAQKLSKWEKQQLKEEKKERREYEKLDKENAQADKEALTSLQKGIIDPFVYRLNFYFVLNVTRRYGSGSGYNFERDKKNWETGNALLDAAKAIPGVYTVALERKTDSLLFKRTDILLTSNYAGPATYALSILNYLRNKDYSPDVNIRLGEFYKKGHDVYPDNSSNYIRVQSFDSAYKFINTAAVAGSADAMGMLGDFKIHGDGDRFEKPSPSTYKYLDTISAGIWYKKQFDALYANKSILTYEDSLSPYMLYKIAYGPGDIDEKGVEYYNNNDAKKAYKYWLASITFRNSAYAFYRIGYLYYKGEGGKVQYTYLAQNYFEQAGKLGFAPGYYAAALTEEFGSAKRGQFLQKATAMGYKPASDALSRDNMRMDEMNRISLEKTRSRNFYTDDDEDDAGNTNSSTKGNSQTKRTSSVRTCSSCGGSGQVHTTIPGGAKKNGVTIFGEYHTCSSCNGKGYY